MDEPIVRGTIMAMSASMLEAIIQLRRALARAAAATFTGEISGREAAILRELRSSGPVAQVHLAHATASDPSAIVRSLDHLQRSGLLARHRSQTDRREMAVTLTPSGRKALGPLDVAHARLAEAMGKGLSSDERTVFIALAEKITRSLATVAEGEAAVTKARR